ncbi:HupE/UreJ family protein [Ancylomarina longa]|nr:HupE/UreJ family protein [Ancylomarina longa]
MNMIFSSFQTSFNYLISISSFDHFLILLFVGSIFHLKNPKSYLSLILALIIGSSIGFVLSNLNVLNFSSSSIKLAMAISFLAIGIHNMLSTNIIANAIRYNFFALIGVVIGISLNSYFVRIYGSNFSFSKSIGFNLGIFAAYIAITLSSLLLSNLLLLIFKMEKKSYYLAISGIGIGISLVLIYLRYK